MEIKNFKGTKKVLAKIKNTSVKISIHNLYNKKNFNFNKIKNFIGGLLVHVGSRKKFINVEKIENFTVQKNIICSATGNLDPILHIYLKNNGLK